MPLLSKKGISVYLRYKAYAARLSVRTSYGTASTYSVVLLLLSFVYCVYLCSVCTEYHVSNIVQKAIHYTVERYDLLRTSYGAMPGSRVAVATTRLHGGISICSPLPPDRMLGRGSSAGTTASGSSSVF